MIPVWFDPGAGGPESRPVARFLLFVLLFVTPLAFAILILGQDWEERSGERSRGIQEQVRKGLLELSFRTHPLVQANDGIRRLRRWIEAQGFAPRAGRPLPPCFPSGFKVQVGIFTPAGELWEPAWGKVASRFLWTQFWRDVCRREFSAVQLQRYQKLLGIWVSYDDATWAETIQEISTPSGPGLFFYCRGPGSAGLAVYVTRYPDPLARWRHVLAREPPRDGDLWVMDPRTSAVIGTSHLRREESAILRRAGLDPVSVTVAGNRCYASLATEDNLVLLGRKALGEPVAGANLRPLLVLAFLLSPLWWLLSGGNPLERLGIQNRLLLLFGLSASLPVVVLLQMGWKHLDETSRRLEEEVQEVNLARLRSADGALRKAQERQDRIFRALVRGGRQKAPGDFAAWQARLERARNRGQITDYGVIDADGRRRVTHWSDPQGGDLEEMFAKEMIRRYRNDRFPEPDNSLAWAFFQLIQSPLIGFDAISDSPGASRFLEIGGAAILWYWEVFRAGAPSDPGFIGLIRTATQLQQDVLRHRLPPGVHAYDLLEGCWYPREPALGNPESLLAPALAGRRIFQTRRMEGGRQHLVSVFPSTIAAKVCFLTIADLGPALQRLRRLRWLFLLAAGFTLVLAGLLARVISGTLLVPLGRLAEGVTAFENGRRDLRLPALGEDEIGVMGEAFNAMVRETREVNAARRVQESLIPARPESVPEYQLSLRYLPLEDLAGDYCDTIRRPDGTLFLAIGDVTGHGIASALQTAMAKAVCSQGCRDGLALPELFTMLNDIIREGKESGRFMTFCGGFLDPRDHSWNWISAGHNYPVVRWPDGRSEFLRHTGFPLGMRAMKRWEVSRVDLPPGTLVMFYTDGLVESRDPAGVPFGYDRLLACLAAAGGTAEQVVEEVLQTFRGFVGETPLDDDVTLLVLRRSGSQSTPPGLPLGTGPAGW